MPTELITLYRSMLFSRLFEASVARLWHAGRISGEMHLGMGEEAIAAGVVSQLIDGDALALDHRGTPELLMRGVDPAALLCEFLGQENGLCRGMGGHMHLFAPDLLAASSGIVGSSGPAAAGFALAAKRLRLGTVAVAFFGEGAMNQGMLLESMNLAAAWKLPVLFVCKTNQWSITTRTASVTGGNLIDRARGFGLATREVNGLDVFEVWNTANRTLDEIRSGNGPAYLLAHCSHLEGHFLGDPLLELGRTPLKAFLKRGGGLMRALFRGKGKPFRERLDALLQLNSSSGALKTQSASKFDPVCLARQALDIGEEKIAALENEVQESVNAIVARALQAQEAGI